jgi:hypothetical protein
MLENKPEVAPNGKLPYHVPQLSVFGDIKTMTLATNNAGGCDNPGQCANMSVV